MRQLVQDAEELDLEAASRAVLWIRGTGCSSIAVMAWAIVEVAQLVWDLVWGVDRE